jgi:hypothetical protein
VAGTDAKAKMEKVLFGLQYLRNTKKIESLNKRDVSGFFRVLKSNFFKF